MHYHSASVKLHTMVIRELARGLILSKHKAPLATRISCREISLTSGKVMSIFFHLTALQPLPAIWTIWDRSSTSNNSQISI